ncbi:MAG: AAA family ATPase [Candidatus Spechtbacteria bacterium]|nr:AAA family ATPase [Candidatus Spechtbacteria bacterium]
MSVMTISEAVREISMLQKEIRKVIVGMDDVVESVLICLFCNGHVLLEGAPGLGKTLLLKTLGRAMSLDCRRVSFASDILPGDIVGVEVFDSENQRTKLVERGPVFTNLFLCDELNRASTKSKSRILEPMQEQQVTVGGETLALPQPFMVMATQNPLEAEGTYPLGRAELDRFLMKVLVQYPSLEDEIEIARRYSTQKQEDIAISQVMDAQTVLEICDTIRSLHAERRIYELAARIAQATRPEQDQCGEGIIAHFGGASPRVPIALVEAARVHAALNSRNYVSPADLQGVALRILRHRLVFELGVEEDEKAIQNFVQKVCDEVIRGEK